MSISLNQLKAAVGRNPMFKSQREADRTGRFYRQNLAGDDIAKHGELLAVASNTDTVFTLKNYDVLNLGFKQEDGKDIDYRTNM